MNYIIILNVNKSLYKQYTLLFPKIVFDVANYLFFLSVDYFTFSTCLKLLPLQPLVCEIKHIDGSSEKIELKHTFNEGQIEWFKAGSALNKMKEMQQ